MVTNIGLNQSKQKSAENNRSTNQSVFDKISALLAKVSKDANDIGKDGKFYGYVLYTNRLTTQEFLQLFKGNDPFITEVIFTGAETNTDVSGTVLEMYVDIPQFSDFLPRPNLKNLQKFIKERDEAKKNLEQTEKIKQNVKINNVQEEFKKTLEIITMYPRVYKYTEASEYYGLGTACEVELPYGNKETDFASMGYGYFKGSINGRIDLGAEGLNQQILDIIKEA